ncbi:MAG: hypothetical protein ACE10K_10475 [Rhodothermales bacterium]
MKRYRAAHFVLVLFFVLCGCLESEVPLSSSDQSIIDPRLIGRWELIETEEDEGPAGMLVLQFNDHEYYVEYYYERDDGTVEFPDTLRFRAYTTPIDGALFANLQCIGCDERTFIFYRYAVSEDGLLTVRAVEEELFKSATVETSEALYAFVKENLDKEALYDEEEGQFRKVVE